MTPLRDRKIKEFYYIVRISNTENSEYYLLVNPIELPVMIYSSNSNRKPQNRRDATNSDDNELKGGLRKDSTCGFPRSLEIATSWRIARANVKEIRAMINGEYITNHKNNFIEVNPFKIVILISYNLQFDISNSGRSEHLFLKSNFVKNFPTNQSLYQDHMIREKMTQFRMPLAGVTFSCSKF
ncbi:hypothetical protein V1477_021234 [Vespula maculifrons]|uniref:Uncharacterized protein n=1 Tax=Vespula maculifrons TaxID=7453 RepID=A0ABD2AIU0_VESMC